MQGRMVTFGFGVLTGLGVGTGYWRGYQQVNVNENNALPIEDSSNTLEQQLFKYGHPEPPFSPHTYSSHSVLYDRCRKVPVWSAEVISEHCISGSANRKKSRFQPDPQVPERFSSSNSDYWNSGWSRGHMTPAGDCKHSQDAMDDSHYLTNIVPQDLKNNSGYWNRLEMYCRDLARRYSSVHVISGPLYLPSEPVEEGGKKFVKYQVIGANNVAVPTHLYKVILAEKGDERSSPATHHLTMGVFVVPNAPLVDEDLSTFQTTLSELETLSGISFHSKLNTSQVNDLCKTDTCKLMTRLQHKQFIYTKRLQWAKNEQQVEEILREAERRGMTSDSITQAASRKRSELEQSIDKPKS